MTYTAPQLPQITYGEANVRLGRLEVEEDISILLAVESGSRAWGFPSPDSDNDVRFLYTRPVSHYLGLTTPRDTIERPINDIWDLSGWDIRKALQLMTKGNATPAEWLQSPLIYREHGSVPFKLRSLLKRHASPKASVKHYYGLTTTCYMRDIGSKPTNTQIVAATAEGAVIKGLTEVNQKKYLYAIRGALAISYVRAFPTEIPPMTLPALMAFDIIPDGVRPVIQDILARKATMGEFGKGPRISELDSFIETNLAWVKDNGMDKIESSPEFIQDANQLLLDALGIG